MKIIYLHIRKCAGSSFRGVAQQNYGIDNVVWEHRPEGNIVKHLKENVLLGGHFSFSDIKNEFPAAESIFVTSVRHPIERIISLFNYHIFSDSWVGKVAGFDKSSLLNTIKNCKSFYNLIDNDQCYTISGYRKFNKTIDSINRNNFIIGEQSDQELFINSVSELFAWEAKEQIFSNTAKNKMQTFDSLTTDEIDYLFSICSEDYKLYEYIKSKGVLISESMRKLDMKALQNKVKTEASAYHEVLIRPTEKTINVTAGEKTTFSVVIENNSDADLICNDMNPINFSYHLSDVKGNNLVFDGVRTKLPQVIKKLSSIKIEVVFSAPMEKGIFIIIPSLVKENIFWFDEINKNHSSLLNVNIV